MNQQKSPGEKPQIAYLMMKNKQVNESQSIFLNNMRKENMCSKKNSGKQEEMSQFVESIQQICNSLHICGQADLCTQ